MKYQTKLYLSFLGIATISSMLGLAITQAESRSYLFHELQSKVMSIAATTATTIDGNLVKQIKTSEDEKLPAYTQIQQQLRKIRNANRRTDAYVKYIYTFYPDPSDPHKFLFGVDAEESEKDVSHPGTQNTGATSDQIYDHLHEVYSYGQMNSDQWGTWLTGYAPVLDGQGNFVGIIGVDVSADFVNAKLDQLLLHSLIGFVASVLVATILAMYLSKKVAASLNALMLATAEIAKGDFSYRVKVIGKDEFGALAQALNTMSEGLEEKERLKTGFAHYVSQHVLDKILKDKGSPKLEGERRKITVLFSDIREFTHISESRPPEEVVALLNEYFKTMLEIIFKHNGMLDKLIGDGIMAEFGAPTDDPQQERNAVIAAIEMQNAISDLRDKWKAEGKPVIEVGIGIHTGEAIIGSIGSEKRMEYTAIGDTVNVASRLENVTKEGTDNIIISESTFKALYDEFPFKHLGLLKLEGKGQPVNAYAILPMSKTDFAAALMKGKKPTKN